MIVTRCVPAPTSVPASGDCVIVNVPLSVAVTFPVKSGTATEQPAPASAVRFVAQAVIAGVVVSTTVNVAVQLVELPELSATVSVTVCGPTPTRVPADGNCVMVGAPLLSDAVTPAVKSGTGAWPLETASVCWLPAQLLIVGGVVSLTTNDTVQFVEFPALSLTVTITLLVPRPTCVPAVGDWVRLMLEQLSEPTTPPVKSGTGAWPPLTASPDWSDGQVVTTGAVLSWTMNDAVALLVLPALSTTKTVTVLVPRVAFEPSGGS